MPDPIHSTGRGGAGNIGHDDTIYTDGAIIREGPADEEHTSRGRGGAGNVSGAAPTAGKAPAQSNGKAPADASASTLKPDTKPAPRSRSRAEDMIPEPALQEKHQSNFHTGRGGEGNIHKEKYGGHSHAPGTGLLERIKSTLGFGKKE